MDVYFKKDIKILDQIYEKNKNYVLFYNETMKEDYESLCRICFYWGEPLNVIMTPYIEKKNIKKKIINKNPYINNYK